MPQLDIFNWLNQVFMSFAFFIIFYFVLAQVFTPLFAGVQKLRIKIQIFRFIGIYISNLQTKSFVKSLINVLQSLVSNNLIILWLYLQSNNKLTIKTWLFQETNLLLDLETKFVAKGVITN